MLAKIHKDNKEEQIDERRHSFDHNITTHNRCLT